MSESSTTRTSRLQRWSGALHDAFPGLWLRLGKLEEGRHEEAIDQVEITRPIYVTGLARSGTTILLELLNAHPATVSHRYRDFPFLEMPITWDRFLASAMKSPDAATERAHGDGLLVTPDSPEAMEEILWMRFFPKAHDPLVTNVLDRETVNPKFEAFYRRHIQKLLWLRGGSRYLAKGNYNISRLSYLAKLFPDAHFIVALRKPEEAISSSIRQHFRFIAAAKADPAGVKYMARAGHFEFGPGRRPICFGDPLATAEVRQLWDQNKEVEGWALYWTQMHGWLKQQLSGDTGLAKQIVLIDHDRLAARAKEQLGALHETLGLSLENTELEKLAARVSASKTSPDLSTADQETIASQTRPLYDDLLSLAI